MRRNNCWLAVLAFSTALPILRHGSARERVPVVDGSQVAHSEVPYSAKQSSSGPEAVDETGAIFPEETVSHPSRTNEPDNNDNNNHPANRVANRNPALAWHTSDHTNLRDHVRGNDDQFENVRNPDAGFKENFPGLDESQAPKDRAEGANRSLARINETQELDRASQAAKERRLSPWIHRDTVNVSPGTVGDVIRRDQEIFRRASSRKRGVDWGNDRRGSRGSLVQPGNQYFGHVGSSSRDDDSVTSSRGDAERKAGFETSGRVAGDIPGGIDVRLVGSSGVEARIHGVEARIHGVEARISGGRTVNDDGQFRGGVNNILESSKRTFKTVEKTVDQQQQYLGFSRSKSAEAFKTSDEELAENDHQFSDIKRLAGKEDQLQFSDPKSPTEGTIQLFKESSTINLDEGLQLLEFMRPAKEEPKAFRPSEKEIDVEHRLKPSETLKNSKKGLKIADPELSFSRSGQKTSLYSLMTIKRRHRRNTESSSERIRSSSSDPHEAGIKSSESRSPFDPGWNRSPTGMKNEERASEEELVVPTSCKSAGAERAYVPGVSSQQRSTVNSEDNGGGALCSRNFFREQKSTPIVESPTIVSIRSAPDPVPNRKNEELGTSDTIDNGFDGIGDGDASSNEFLASLTVTRSDLADPTASVKEPWIGNAALIAPVADRGYRSDTSSGGNEDLRAEKAAEGDGDSDPDDGRDCEDKNAKLSGPNDRDKDNRLPRTDRSNYSSNEDCADRGIEGCFGRKQGEDSVGDAVLDDLKLNGHGGGDKDKVDRYAESYDTNGVLLDSKHESFQENYGSRRVDGRGFDGQRGGEQSKQSAVNGALVYALNQDKGDDVGVTKVDYGSSRKDNRQSSVVSNNGEDKQGASNNESVYSTIQNKEMGVDAKILNYEKKRKNNGQLSEQSDNDKNNRGMSAYSLNYGKEDDVVAQKLEYSSNREDNDFSGQDNLGEDNRGTLKDEFAYSMSQDKEKGSEEEVLHNGSSHKENGDSSGQMINGKDNGVISKDGGVYSISHKEEKDVISEELLNSENYQGNVRLNGQSDSDQINRVSSNKGVKPEKSSYESHRKDNDYFSGHNDSNKNNEEILKEGFVYSSNRNKEKRVEPNKLDYGSNSEINAQLKNKSDSANDNQTAPNNKPPHSTNPTEQTNTKPKKLDYMITHASYTEPNNAKHTQTPPNTDLPHLETLNIEPVITAKRLSSKDSPRSDKSVEEARAHLIDSYNEKLIDRLTGEAADNLDIVKPGIPGPATNNRNNDAADKRRPGRVHRDKTAKKAFSSTSSMKGSTSKDMTKESGNASTNSERGSPAVGRNSAYLANDMNTPTAERASNVVENDGKSAGDRSGRQGKAAVGRPRNSHPETASHEPTVINYADNEKKGARSISLAPDFDDVNERTRVIGTERSRDSTNRNSGRDDGRNGPDFEDVNPRGAGKQSAGLMEDQLRPRKERRSSVRSDNPDTGDLHPGTGSNGIDVASNVTSLKIDSGGSSVPGPISLDRPPGFISGEDRSVPSESYESVSTFSDVSWTDQDLDVSSLTTDDLERSLEIDSTVGSLENDDYSRLDDELAGSENASAHDQERPNLWPVKHSAVVEGDLVLGGLMMVHEREDTITCGPVMPQGGVQALEAMLYTLDWLNEQEIVPGVKIGAHILDDCDKDTYGLEMAVDFIKGSISNIDGAEYHCNKTAVRKVISGVVGAASSVTSIQVANLLRLFRIPQVSFFSTSPELSNKQRFEYFSRTIPSDHYQVKAMVDIVKKMNWSYVSIIYEESNYGIKAFEVLEDLLGKYNICIAIKEKLVKDSGVATAAAYNDIVLKLLTKPRAKGCIIFGSDQEVAGVMRAVRRCNATGTFSWIGSDGWSARRLVSDGNEPEVEGTLSVQPQANPVRGFEEYFLNLTVENNRRNPWFVEFWEDHFKCRYPNASRTPYNQKYTENCTTKERLMKNETAFEDQLQFVSDAVMAFAYAFKDMHRELCNGKPGLCDAMKPTKGTELLRYLQKVDFEGLSGDKFKFDKNGDGPARYNIIHFKQTEPGKYEWVRVGEYLEGELRLNSSEIQFKLGHPLPPESVCSLPCEVGQAKKYVEGEKCCWHCFNCTQYQIRHPDDETQCIKCSQGTVPDETHSICRDIPEEFLRPESGWAIGAMSISASGILITFFVCGVFLKHNDTPVVRASGRELSYVLLCGILLCYLVTFALVMRPTDIVCSIQRFAAGFCFTVVYAALLTKTNRISRIFNASKHSAKRPSFISPRSQLIICSGLVFVQILINGVWMIIDPAKAMHHYPTREDNLLVCNSYVDASYMIAFAYPIILIVVCTVYAVLTRKIPEAFNESKHIGFTMYTTCVIWLAFVPLYFGTGSNVALRITSMSVTISLSASVTIVCLFSPKLYIILIRPERNVRQSMMPPRYSTTKSSAMTATNVSSMIAPATLTGATCDQNKGVKKHIISTIDCSTQSEYYELEVKDQKNGKPAPTVISRLTQTSSNDLEQTEIVGKKDAKENPASTTATTVTKDNANTTKQINNNARIGNGPVNQADISL